MGVNDPGVGKRMVGRHQPLHGQHHFFTQLCNSCTTAATGSKPASGFLGRYSLKSARAGRGSVGSISTSCVPSAKRILFMRATGVPFLVGYSHTSITSPGFIVLLLKPSSSIDGVLPISRVHSRVWPFASAPRTLISE